MPLNCLIPQLKFFKTAFKPVAKISVKTKNVLIQPPPKGKNSWIYALQIALGGPRYALVASQGSISAPSNAICAPYNKGAPHDAITSTSSWKWVTGASEVKACAKAGAGAGAGFATLYTLVLVILPLFGWFLLKHFDRRHWKRDRCEQCGRTIKE